MLASNTNDTFLHHNCVEWRLKCGCQLRGVGAVRQREYSEEVYVEGKSHETDSFTRASKSYNPRAVRTHFGRSRDIADLINYANVVFDHFLVFFLGPIIVLPSIIRSSLNHGDFQQESRQHRRACDDTTFKQQFRSAEFHAWPSMF
jgi:hypothetical protein